MSALFHLYLCGRNAAEWVICMKLKHKIVIEILLVIAAIAVFIYNFSMQREIAYIASIVAVCGTIAFLIKDIVKLKRDK